MGRRIFDHIIGPKGMLRDRTRVLATNKLSVLPEVNHIFVLKDGQISESGSYESLLRKGGLFSKLLVDYVLENAEGVNITEVARADLITKELKRLEEKQTMESLEEKSENMRKKSVQNEGTAVAVKSKFTEQGGPGNLTGQEVSKVGSVGLDVHLNFVRILFGFKLYDSFSNLHNVIRFYFNIKFMA